MSIRKCVCYLTWALAFLALSFHSQANPVIIPRFTTPLCGINTTTDISKQLSLRQYLSHFSIDELDQSSLKIQLDSMGQPCVRPVVKNTSVSLIHRVVELGYADWNPTSGMLDLDTWMISQLYSMRPTVGDSQQVGKQQPPPRVTTRKSVSVPWTSIIVGAMTLCGIVTLLFLGRLSSLLTRRTSIAALGGLQNRSKIRGIAIPTLNSLPLANTDIQAIAYTRSTEKYRHNGWQLIDSNTEHAMCTIDDGTGCIDIDLTHATVHFKKQVAIYNGIPGDVKGRTPYVDDTFVVFKYIPVGAVVTIIGTLTHTENTFRTTKNVHLYEGDERSEVRLIKVRVFFCIGVLLALGMVLFFLRHSS